MKKTIFILMLICTKLSMAQATRFVYQVSMVQDSTKVDDITTERAYLDVDGQKSFFYSEASIKRDSIMQRMRLTKNFDRNQIQNLRTAIDYNIEKNLDDQTLNFIHRLGADQYAYTEKIPNTWKIIPETVMIDKYEAQKAEIHYGGRIWFAWFAQSIPLPDGPYKFGGLPGLIIKLEDSQHNYNFSLIETKKIASSTLPQGRRQNINISKEKFVGLQKKFLKDPSTFLNANNNRRGRLLTDPKAMKDRQQRIINEVKSKNNLIEKH